jgi:hypothetical protein
MPSLATALGQELARLLEPLIVAAGSAERWPVVLALVGHTADVAGNPALRAALDDLGTLANLGDVDLETWDGIEAILNRASRATHALHEIERAADDPALAERLKQLGPELSQQLTAVYLRRFHERLFRFAAILGIVDPGESHDPQPAQFSGNVLVRSAWSADELHFDRVGPLLRDPWAVLHAAYLPNDLKTAPDAHAAAARFFPLLRAALGELGLASAVEKRSLLPEEPNVPSGNGDHFGNPEPDPDATPPIPSPADLGPYYRSTQPRLTIRIPQLQADGTLAGTFLGIDVVASSLEHPGAIAGLIVELTGALNWIQTQGSWTIQFKTEGEVPAFSIGPQGLKFAPLAAGQTGATGSLSIAPVADGAPAFNLGDPKGTRLELGKVQFGADFSVTTSRQSAGVSILVDHALLALAAGDGDSFLAKVLPADGLNAKFDLGMAWSNTGGFAFRGAGSLDAALPIDISLGGIRASTLYLTIEADNQKGISAEVSLAVGVTLGPIAAVIDRVGLLATASFPASGGNLGVADVAFKFKPPSGLGVSVDAAVVKGGGFLEHRGDEYSGALELAVADIAVKAFGSLQTKLPGGVPGYSFIIALSVEFSPSIQLVFGFSLEGAGGIVGINRTMSIDAIETALWAHHLDGLLFPKDLIAQAPQLIVALDSYFPAAAGRYVIGPMAKIGWGDGIVVGKIALLLELPEPLKLVLLGEIEVGVPMEKPQLELHVSFAGGIDFGKKLAFFDATLHDSRIESFPITGDLAFRDGWGDDGSFALALGGFNPHFQPPAAYPTLKRLGITIGSSVAQIEAQSYIALTANTLQFGARAELTAGTGSFNVHGWLGLDALCERHPMSFIFDLSGGIDLRHGTDVLASVHLDAHLSGPTPWHIAGDASLSLFLFDVSVHFDKTWGPSGDILSLPDPLALVLAAFTTASTFRSVLPPAGRAIVSVAEAAVDATQTVLLDPGGALRMAQRVLPLGQPITRFGGAALGRTVQLSIDGVAAFTTSFEQPPSTTEEFAPAQYFEFSDAEKLSLPSFSRFDAGLEIAGEAIDIGSGARARAVVRLFKYDTTIFDTVGRRPGKDYALGLGAMVAMNRRATAQPTGLGRYAPPAGTPSRVAVAPDRWVIAGAGDLALRPDLPSDGSKVGAQLALNRFLAANPDQRGQLQVVLLEEAA